MVFSLAVSSLLNIFHSFFLGNLLLERQKVTFASKTVASFLVSSSLKDFTNPTLPYTLVTEAFRIRISFLEADTLN